MFCTPGPHVKPRKGPVCVVLIQFGLHFSGLCNLCTVVLHKATAVFLQLDEFFEFHELAPRAGDPATKWKAEGSSQKWPSRHSRWPPRWPAGIVFGPRAALGCEVACAETERPNQDGRMPDEP